MTIAEKIEMYKGKKAFVDSISKVFQDNPKYHSVVSVNYEVYQKEITREERTYREIVEFVIVRYIGGGKCVKVVTGNSNTANFQVIGTLLNGGYYEENGRYDSMLESGYEILPLSSKSKLDELLEKPMAHISDVRQCFNYCQTSADVEKVIKMIPSVFGIFSAEYPEDEDVFVLTNYYEENGDLLSEVAEYEFCEGA